VHLEVLPDADARDLLAGHLGGGRLAAEPAAVAELVEFCAGSPLALSIVSARANRHPGFTLQVLADELREESTRLDALNAGGIVITAARNARITVFMQKV